MIDKTATLLALRARALALVTATTGSISLSATTTGYARASGSFLTDGFVVGLEVLAAGFSTSGNNGRSIITALTATAMTVTKLKISTVSASDPTATLASDTANTAEVAGSGRSIVAGLPILRGFENVPIVPNLIGPYVEEDFVPATSRTLSIPTNGAQLEETGLYIIRWFGLTNRSSGSIRKGVDDLMALFAPGTSLTVGSDVVTMRDDVAPQSSQIVPRGNGWSVCSLTVPWRAYTTTAVAA